MQRWAPKPWYIAFMRIAQVRIDRQLLRRSKGRISFCGSTGAYALLLTTTGRRSGQQRSTPLFYKPDGDAFIVVASNFGRRDHPAWSHNLLDQPRARVTVGNRDIPVIARLLAGSEYDTWWQQFAAFSSAYRHYHETSGRTFRIFALEPVKRT